MIRRLIARDDGVGVVTALMVSFIIFTLGGVWYAVAVHELDEVVFDRHRTQSVHAADAGLRHAMYLLAQDASVRSAARGTSPGEYLLGVSGTDCVLQQLQSSGEVLGEYWVRISDPTPSDDTDDLFFIESWGWAPAYGGRQATAKKVELEVELFPNGGFDYALFSETAGITADNKKEIFGDMYSAANVDISNFTRLYDNGTYPGDGDLEVYGSLTISNGSNVEVHGTVTANQSIDDQNSGSDFKKDVISVYADAYFKNATVGNEVRLGGSLVSGSKVNGNTSPPTPPNVIEGATGLDPVPYRSLPTFDPTGMTTYATWSDFLSYYDANKSSLSGKHYVQETGAYAQNWDLKDAVFADDFVLAIEGQVTLRKKPSGLAGGVTAPKTVVVAAINSAGKVTLAQGTSPLHSDDLRFLIYSKGDVELTQLTTIYGAVYADGDVAGNNLTVYYRPPTSAAVGNFTFTDLLYDVVPGVWREVPADDVGAHCNLP